MIFVAKMLCMPFALNQNVFANLKLNTIEVLNEDCSGLLCKPGKRDL